MGILDHHGQESFQGNQPLGHSSTVMLGGCALTLRRVKELGGRAGTAERHIYHVGLLLPLLHRHWAAG